MEKSANAFVFKNPITGQDTSGSSRGAGSWIRNNFGKILIAVLIIGVIVEVIYGAYTLFAPARYQQLAGPLQLKVNELQNANLSLVPDKSIYKPEDEVEIDVKLYTGGYSTASTDLVVKYDPLFLEPRAEDFGIAGNIYSEYPAIEVDKDKGMIGISGITLPDKGGFMGVGSFTTLYFKALKEGQTKVSIEYEPSATADSNVVLAGGSKDILGSVGNADIMISTGAAASPDDQGQKCENFVQSCQDAGGSTGTQVCNGGSSVDGACKYDAEYTTSCDVCKTQ